MVVAALVVLPAVGCGDDSKGNGDGADTAGDGDGDAPAGVAGPSVMHRLTEDQLNHTIDDLFGLDLPDIDLPPDIPVDGLKNQAITREVSPFVVESLQRDLQAVTAAAMTDPGAWLFCAPDGGADPATCGRDSLTVMMRRAFRRNVSADEVAWIHGLFDGWYAQHGFGPAMEMSLLTLMQSPEFLYQVEVGDPTRVSASTPGSTPLTDFEMASRLSYFLWDTMPDNELFAAADAQQLRTPEQIRGQAERMLADPRAQAALVSFHRQWLDADAIDDVEVDEATYFEGLEGDFGEEAGADITGYRLALYGEFDGFIERTILTQGTLASLLTGRQTWASEFTASIYGATIDRSQPRTIDIFPGVDAITVDCGDVVFPGFGGGSGSRTIWEGVLTPKKGIADDDDDGRRGGGGQRLRPKRLRIELAMAVEYDSESEPEPGNYKNDVIACINNIDSSSNISKY